MAKESDKIADVIGKWQERLLQVDRRNNLLYFKPGRSALRIINTTPDAISEELIDAKHHGLSFDFVEPVKRTRRGFESPEDVPDPSGETSPRVTRGDLRADVEPAELQRRLKILRRRDKEWEEEQGLNVLFLAIGVLDWIDEDGEPARAPLILVPCDLAQESPRDPYYLIRESDDAESNATLIYVAVAKHGISLPEYGDSAPSEYLKAIARAISKREDWAVSDEMFLGTFAYSKMPMVKDLDKMRNEGVTHALVRALAGDTRESHEPDSSQGDEFPDWKDLKGGGLDDLLDIHDQFAVLPADFSQLRAIELARSGADLLIHGPPGTGKSQTIANIIATLLANGKRVLFVSEKTAALDVVKRRLEECGLGVFCLDLHSERGKKSSVYKQLREAQEDARNVEGKQVSRASLSSKRQLLNTAVRALHERREPLGKTIFEMQGMFAELQELPAVNFNVTKAGELTEEFFRQLGEASARVARRSEEFREHTTSRWLALTVQSATLSLADVIRRDMDVVTEAAEVLREDLRRYADEWLGHPNSENCAEGMRLKGLLDHLAIGAGVPAGWLGDGVLLRLKASVEEQRELQTTRREAIERVTEAFGPDWRSINYRSLSSHVNLSREDHTRLRKFIGKAWMAAVTSPGVDLVHEVETVVQSIEDLFSCFGALTDGHFNTEVESWRQLKIAIENARSMAKLAPVPDGWLEPGDRRTELDTARVLATKLGKAEDLLAERFDDGIVADVDEELVSRYRAHYQGFWGRIGFTFRRSQRMLMGHLEVPGKLSVDEAVEAIEMALNVRRLREAWAEQEDALAQMLGGRFQGRQTDWKAIKGEIAEVERLSRIMPADHRRRSEHDGFRALLTDPEVPDRLQRALEISEDLRDQCFRAFESLGREKPLPDAERMQAILVLAKEVASPLALIQGVSDELRGYYQRPIRDLEELVGLLADGVLILEIERDAIDAIPTLSVDFGARFEGFDTSWDAVNEALTWTEQVKELLPAQLSAKLENHVVSPSPATEYEAAAASVGRANERFIEQLRQVEDRFDPAATSWGAWVAAPFDQLEEWAQDLSKHAETASGWIAYQTAARDLNEMLGADVVSQIREITPQAELVPKIVSRQIAAKWLDSVYEAGPVLHKFSSRDHDDLRLEFGKLDRSLPLAVRSQVRERCFSAYPDRATAGLSGGQYATLRGQLSRKRGQFSARKLFSRIPQLLQALKPVLLMSPLAVSKFLSRDEERDAVHFDTVIFDEASQVFPEDAIPAIARGEQTIIVGDEQQLPPSNFFRRTLQDGDSDDAGDDEEESSNALEGRESIIMGIAGMGVAESYLDMHYRSRHESLIRYSNHYFYEERLMVFPAPEPAASGIGINDIYLPDARYDPNSKYPNRGEAERAVDELFTLLRTRPVDESVGIVALSRAQADLIQELVDQRRLLERDLDDRFAADRREPIFVKNLENVQGDERDHVILSIGYGPTVASGAVPNRFGPINAEGGQRRLNVAVSRARRSMTVIHCLRPTDIHAESLGAKFLRRYLEYIADPVGAFESEVTVDPAAETESPFEAAVEQALIARGYRVDRQVGVSGYRIDLAIPSEDGSKYDLGIECDGATYHSAPAARDRDWLRQSVLERLGWIIHRVWSTAWIHNPEFELNSIEASISAARSRTLGPTPAALSASTERDHADTPGWEQATDDPAPLDVADGEPPLLFNEYETASLADIKVGPELQFEVSPTLRHLVARVVEVEMPVHVDLVLSRIRERYGLKRAGQVIKKQMNEAIEDAIERNDVGWIATQGKQSASYLVVTSGEAPIRPRRPGHNQPPRDIGNLSSEEIQAGLLIVVNAMYGGEHGPVIVETARQFGYARTGSDISSSIREAISSLIDQGKIVDSNGMLTLGMDSTVELPKEDSRPRFPQPLKPEREAADSSGKSEDTDPSIALRALGLEVIDKRANGGNLWAVGGPELKNQLRPLGFKFAEHGGRATKKRPGWFLTPK